MSESRLVIIENEVDVINARQQTRQVAKDAGLQIMDQARISLAVSSMAHVVKLGEAHTGKIMINRIMEEGRMGVQVIWMITPDAISEDMIRSLDDTDITMMVDDMDIQNTAVDGLYITAVKWGGKK